MILTVIQLKPAPLVVTVQGNDVRLIANRPSEGGAGVTAHADLTGLPGPADDHPQYHTDARGDLRYYSKAYVDAALAAIATGKENTITAGTVSDYWRGDKTWQALNKAAVGLGNVDNTSDANKPISSAQATVNAAKADLVGGVVPNNQLPALAITEFLGSVANQAAMLALVGQQGDWCIRTDNSKVYIITGPDPTQLADWTAIVYPAGGVWGVITGTLSDQTDLWAQLATYAPKASPIFTGTVTADTITSAAATALWLRTADATGSNATAYDINITPGLGTGTGKSGVIWIRKPSAPSSSHQTVAPLKMRAPVNETNSRFISFYGTNDTTEQGFIATDGGHNGLFISATRLDASGSVRVNYGGGGLYAQATQMIGAANYKFGWGPVNEYDTPDTLIGRDEAAGTLGLRNGTNAQALRVYETYTNSSNYARVGLRSVGGDFILGTEAAGTGTLKQLHIKATLHRFYVGSGAATPAWYINSDGSLTYEGANNGGYIQLVEQTAPAAPGANKGRIFMQDNGSGKSQLMCIFPSGAAQQLAIEP